MALLVVALLLVVVFAGYRCVVYSSARIAHWLLSSVGPYSSLFLPAVLVVTVGGVGVGGAVVCVTVSTIFSQQTSQEVCIM